MQATRIAKGPPMNGDRGFKGRRLQSSIRHEEVLRTYDVQLNGRTCMRGASFPAALIAVRGTAEQIQRSEHKTINITDNKRSVISSFDLAPGDYKISVGNQTIKIKRSAPAAEDDGVLRCGCIDVCRSNCDGRSRDY